MRNALTSIAIGIMLGISTAIVGFRLQMIYKQCKIEAPNHMIQCVFIKDNAE